MDAPLREPLSGSLLALLQENFDSLRTFRRFPLALAISIVAGDGKPPRREPAFKAPAKLPATLVNASVSGFCFSCREEFAPGTLLFAEIELERKMHRVPAIVRRCSAQKKLGRIFYECGVQYVKSEATLLFLPSLAKRLQQRASEL